MNFDFTPEQKAFQQSAEQFAREVVAPGAAAIDETNTFPGDVISAAATLGLFRCDYLSYTLAIETIARASATVAVSLVVSRSLVADLIEHAASNSFHKRWLNAVVAGETPPTATGIAPVRRCGGRDVHPPEQPSRPRPDARPPPTRSGGRRSGRVRRRRRP